ncbi:SIR2 family protein [Salmonella enterica]|nr:SIR2 family protein [Salmonella enterica]ELG4696487.1 SIR2 family protein [Salmonella enterica]ELH7597652.1 SIR2 family protein [Salmonella enterica]ELZ4217195.1 SIR2 family protein [Salmonella enterica]ELZ4219745.1 SIR2 family protein [Salmonella enterica]
MDLFNKHIANILRAKDEESLAIFIGAGVSKSSETKTIKMPSWGDLIDSLISDLNIEGETDYLKIAQLYYLTFGEHLYYKKIKDFFPDNIPHSKIHDLIFKLNPHSVITTNWDTLLEAAINAKTYFYNVISSDKDLMKSYLGKKLIKMHGDFKNHNIVFKEDDYLNYSYKFPLIENYVKSIISTHTVLFLGYSYNDIDLKQIIKWTQNHSSVRPPMYLVVFKDIPAQRKYLESHGIITIILADEKLKPFNNDSYSNKLYTFLYNLNSLELCTNLSDIEIINLIYSRVKSLQSLNAILAEQITRCFTNCGLMYIDDNGPKALLRFYDTEVTSSDNNIELRGFYKKFVSLLNDDEKVEKYKSHLQKLFFIFKKASIYGVILNDKRDRALLTTEILPNDSLIKIDKEINFNYYENITPIRSNIIDKSRQYNCFQLNKLDEAYSIIEEELSEEIRQKDYANILISLFNQNVILHSLKYGFSSDRDNYSTLEENKIHELYDDLPRNIKKTVSVIYDLVTFNYLFNLHYTVSSLLTKYSDVRKRNTRLLIDGDLYKTDFLFENLIIFVLKNGCLIDVYKEFKDVIRKVIEIKIIKNAGKNELSLTKLELYSCIKYIDEKTLTLLLRKEDKKPIKLSVQPKELDWLILIALNNLAKAYSKNSKAFNPVEIKLINTIKLLSLIKVTVDQDSIILKILDDTLKSSYHNLAFYDAISEYIVLRYNAKDDNSSIDGIKSIIDTFLNKLISRNLGGYEIIAIVNRGLANIFSVAENLDVNIEDADKIDKLLLEISSYSNADRARAVETILYDLYRITTGEIREKIKNFIKNTSTVDFSEERKIKFELFLLASGISDNYDNLPERVTKLIENYKGFSFNSEAEVIRNLLRHIVNTRNLSDFSQALSKIEEVMNNYK